MSSSGTKFAKFTLVKKLAVGGMAEIHLARHDGMAGFAKHVVIKRIHSHLSRDPQFVSMFLDEARLVARLSHPNIASVHDFGREEEGHYLVMEYVHGVPLSAAIKKGRGIEPAHALRIASEMCAGLHYAHSAKDDSGESLHVIHRDVSPQNVLLSYDGSVKLIDFGVAKAKSQAHKTKAGAFKGKYAYMSPEQARSQSYDHRADQHAVGILLWEMLTGRGLFHRSSAWDSMQAVLSQHPRSVRQRYPDLPEEIDHIIARALAKDPDDRYESCGELQGALDECAASAGLFSNSMRLGEYVRGLFDVSSSTGEFRVHELRQQTDVSTMPDMEAHDDEDTSEEEVAVASEQALTGDYEPGSIDVVIDSDIDDDGGEEEDTADHRVLRGSSEPWQSPHPSDAVPVIDAPPGEDATAPLTRGAAPWNIPESSERHTSPEPPPSSEGSAEQESFPPPSPGSSAPPHGLARPSTPTGVGAAAGEQSGQTPSRRGAVWWVLLALVGIAVGVGAGFLVWRSQSPPSPAGEARGGASLPDVAPARDGGDGPRRDGGTMVFSTGDAALLSDVAADGRPEDGGVPEPIGDLPTGFLTVSSDPSGARVSVDGRNTGERTAVRDLPLDPGDHVVELSLEGYRRWRQRVTVELAETVRLRAKLVRDPSAPPPGEGPPPDEGGEEAGDGGPVDYGLLSIDSSPPTQVMIDGRELGQTPIRGEEVPVGTHRLTLVTVDGRRFDRRVTVSAGRSTRRTFDLDPQPETPEPGPPESSPPGGDEGRETPSAPPADQGAEP